jgi:hypothetical protein
LSLLAELLVQKEAEASLVALVVAETESVPFRRAQWHQPAAVHPSPRRQLRPARGDDGDDGGA